MWGGGEGVVIVIQWGSDYKLFGICMVKISLIVVLYVHSHEKRINAILNHMCI